jgi:hypothetical protein
LSLAEAAAACALLIAQLRDNQPALHNPPNGCQTPYPVDQAATKDTNRRSRDEIRVVRTK